MVILKDPGYKYVRGWKDDKLHREEMFKFAGGSKKVGKWTEDFFVNM